MYPKLLALVLQAIRFRGPFVHLSCVDNVPDGSQDTEACPYHGGIIHAHWGDWKHAWHAEQEDLKRDPSDCDDVEDPTEFAAVPPSVRYLPPAMQHTDNDGNGIAYRQSNDTHRNEGSECRAVSEVD